MAVTEANRDSVPSKTRSTSVKRTVTLKPMPQGRPTTYAAPRISYDALADVLSFRWDGPEHAVIVSRCHGEVCALLDREEGTISGFRIEHYFAAGLAEHPETGPFIEGAELRGITRAEAIAERDRVLGWQGKLKGWWYWTMLPKTSRTVPQANRRAPDAMTDRQAIWAHRLIPEFSGLEAA